jgi:hypothetical protein
VLLMARAKASEQTMDLIVKDMSVFLWVSAVADQRQDVIKNSDRNLGNRL